MRTWTKQQIETEVAKLMPRIHEQVAAAKSAPDYWTRQNIIQELGNDRATLGMWETMLDEIAAKEAA